MNGRAVAGVIVGGIVDILATNLFAMPVALWALLKYHLLGLPDAAQTLGHVVVADPAIATTMWFLGAAASVLGGYTAAVIARRRELLTGALSAYLCTAFGIAALVHDTSGTPLVLHVISLLVSPVLGLLGGYLRLLQTRRVAHA
jgi:hypothetical protein